MSVMRSLAPSVATGGQAVLYKGNSQGHAVCVTPNPGTCRKQVLLPYFSKGALTCYLDYFGCLGCRVGTIYPCLLRSDGLMEQVHSLLVSMLASRALSPLTCLPQPLQSPACFYIINKSVFFCLERKRAEGFLKPIG